MSDVPQINGSHKPQDLSQPTATLSIKEDQAPVSQYDGQKPDQVDFTNYFVTYGYIYHQKEMIEDHIRTGKYFEAILGNRAQFEGRVVLDLGAGSGVLSIFAAKAGARKVYAVEATDVAKMAKRLAEHNQVGHVVEVIQGVSESIDLPEKVDIIISEWMGYFLLRESMLDSVLDARDRFLKPGGALYPSHASLWLMPLCTPLMERKAVDYERSMKDWDQFVTDCNENYRVDFSVLEADFRREHTEYYLGTCHFQQARLEHSQGPGVKFKEWDLHTCTPEEIKSVVSASVRLPLMGNEDRVNALCGYFTVDFKGSTENPAGVPIELSTAPSKEAWWGTHWGQQVMLLADSPTSQGFFFQKGNYLNVDIQVHRMREFKRHLTILVTAAIQDPEEQQDQQGGKSSYCGQAPKKLKFDLA